MITHNFQVQSPKKPEMGRKEMHLFTLYYFLWFPTLFIFFKNLKQFFIFRMPRKRIGHDIQSNLRLSVLKDHKQLGIEKQ